MTKIDASRSDNIDKMIRQFKRENDKGGKLRRVLEKKFHQKKTDKRRIQAANARRRDRKEKSKQLAQQAKAKQRTRIRNRSEG